MAQLSLKHTENKEKIVSGSHVNSLGLRINLHPFKIGTFERRFNHFTTIRKQFVETLVCELEEKQQKKNNKKQLIAGIIFPGSRRVSKRFNM